MKNRKRIRQRIAARRGAKSRKRAERNRMSRYAESERRFGFKRKVRQRFYEKVAARMAAAKV